MRVKLKDLAIGKLEYGSGAAACAFDDDVRYVRITDIDDNGQLGTDIVSPSYYEEKHLLNDGDILFARTGATVGKTLRYKQEMGKCVYAGFLIRMVPDTQQVLPDYVYYFTKSPQYNLFVAENMKVVAQPNINAKQYGDLEFDVPAIAEQKEIVDKLDKVCGLIAMRKKQLQKLDDLVKARFVELFGDTKNNEHKWKTLPLYKVLESGSSVSYGIVQTGDDIEGGIPVFRPIDIAGGKIPQREQLKRTAIDISNQYSRTLLKGYELLITVRGSVGETFRVTSDFAGCNVGRNIVPLRFDTTIVDYSFMQHFFAQEGTKRVLESMTKGIALQGLNMSEFREIDVIIPNMSLQQQFAAFIEQTDKSKLTIQQSLDKLELMKKALMQKYFE